MAQLLNDVHVTKRSDMVLAKEAMRGWLALHLR